jgi:hypothetical protein
MTRETLKNLDLISQVTQQSIADIDIIVLRFGLGLGGRGWLIEAWFFGTLLLVC